MGTLVYHPILRGVPLWHLHRRVLLASDGSVEVRST
jgi:hypothetical protein